MLKFVICKLDTPCTLVQSAMRVPQAEPVNFAKALIMANPDQTVDVCMLGHAAKQIEVGNNGTIRTVPYFGNPKSIKDEFDTDTRIIIWQGRHLIVAQMPKNPDQLGTQPTLMNPYSAGDYDRLCAVKLWQVMMYNLLSSNVIPEDAKKYFIVTDLRLPLIELNKVDPVSVPKPLPKDIILVTQAYHAEEYNRWQQKYGNGMNYPEMFITDYMYEFKSAQYLPMHLLPLLSHSTYVKPLHDKHRTSIFQTQSLKYVDDYRKAKLKSALKYVNGHCTLHGRFNAAERGIVVANYPEWSDTLLDSLIDNSNNPSECFFDSAKILADHQASLIITDQRYARFGLVPNRFVEAIAVGTAPLVVDGALDNCDAETLDAVKYLNIKADATEVMTSTNPDFQDGLKIVSNEGDVLFNAFVNGNSELDDRLSKVRNNMWQQLTTSFNKFANAW